MTVTLVPVSIPRITVRHDSPADIAQLLLSGRAFNTHGNLWARREFHGFGEYKPFDADERREMLTATYFVYSYDTPIAWRLVSGSWVYNFTTYSCTTSKHQSLIHSAINML